MNEPEYVENYGDQFSAVQMIFYIAKKSIFINFIKNRNFYIFYPKRSKAAYPPPPCVLDHKLNGFIFPHEYTKLIVFAQKVWWMKDESIMTSNDLVMS